MYEYTANRLLFCMEVGLFVRESDASEKLVHSYTDLIKI
jgi:hypothetical protein